MFPTIRMTRGIRHRLAFGMLGATIAAIALVARAQAPDLALSNGKIITVDERFSIAEAVAIRGNEIVAVGPTEVIAALAGPSTRTIDLRGKTVIPGLIDNHMHLLRAGTTWQREVRWDGVDSRREALEKLKAKARAAGPGEWVLSLGGWTVDQFADDSRPFGRAELDAIVPDNPVLLQASYYRAYLNSRGLHALGLDGAAGGEAWIVRDVHGEPTGEIEEAGIRVVAARLRAPSEEEVEASSRAMIADLNKVGLTAFGSVGCEPDLVGMYRRWADQRRLGVRVFCISGVSAATPEQVDRILPQIAEVKLFQGDSMIDRIAFGESLYRPVHDPMFLARSDYTSEALSQFRRAAMEVAKAGLPLHVHANLRDTLTGFLDQIAVINEQYPIRNLRWVLAHVNQLEESHLERMRELGMYAAVHPWAVINGRINQSVFGDDSYDMPPLRLIQNSGVTWGFGSDGSRANQILPFTTLWWAVTGNMVGGRKVLRQTISREDALIAHTRKNAYLIFQEDRLGAIQPGKLADLVVLDHDYLTVPADEIKDITPLMTIVDGRIVYDAGFVR
jgi:predicted amidohydrolase YtcJ